uniref:Uncharacterized protein n=1 Tax=Pristionchus pacificus TaxID=54126 RepID=A0A2A6BWZ9_PRIPA|eukprot:PDM70425.1 hypothetical protein PRIPAC_46671 [Pristionchus pacificus]
MSQHRPQSILVQAKSISVSGRNEDLYRATIANAKCNVGGDPNTISSFNLSRNRMNRAPRETEETQYNK